MVPAVYRGCDVKIDFSSVLLDLKDKPIEINVDGEKVPMTLALAASEALLIMDPREQDGALKSQYFKLTLRVVNGGEVELEPKDAELIKKKIGARWSPLIVGRAFELLNG